MTLICSTSPPTQRPKYMSPAINDVTDHIDLVGAASRVAAEMQRSSDTLDDDRSFPDAGIGALFATALLMAPFDREHGGSGLLHASRVEELAEILAAIGGGSLPLGRLYEGHVNAVLLVKTYGNFDQIDTMASRAANHHMMAVWNTEGSDGVELLTHGDRKVLQGRKIFASGAGKIRFPLITARAGDKSLLMVLPDVGTRQGDMRGWTAHGMRASASGAVDFTGVEISDHDILGADDDFHRQPMFSAGAWRFCAVQLGGTARLLDLARAHLVSIERQADPYQIARIGSAAIAVETARLWVTHAARISVDPLCESETKVAYVNFARTAVERAGLDVLELVHRSIGLGAFSRSHPIERISRDLATYLRQPNPDKALADGARFILRDARPVLDVFK